jgi:catechol O-methyltransferase
LQPRLVLEFGGYCGYSAVLIGSCLPPDAKLISIEINPVYAAIATKIIEFAGLESKVSVLVADVTTALPAIVAEHGAGSVDAVFIDHWKDRYLPDLKNLESSKLLHVGSVIIADNILYPGAPEYLKYVSDEPKYATKLHHSSLEYSKDVDAVAVSIVQSS